IRRVDEKTNRRGILAPIAAAAVPTPARVSRRVFVVHGHNEEAKLAIARTLERLGLDPVILHKQPDRERTIFQKFEEYAGDVSFAVVLMRATTAVGRGTPGRRRAPSAPARAGS